jgi:hypothetical protein
VQSRTSASRVHRSELGIEGRKGRGRTRTSEDDQRDARDSDERKLPTIDETDDCAADDGRDTLNDRTERDTSQTCRGKRKT